MESSVSLVANDWSPLEPGPAKSKKWKSFRLAAIVCGLVFCLVTGTIGVYCGVLQLFGNIHVVVERQFYRSAQLDRATLARVIQEYRIKSILNLVGARPDASWYSDEIAVSRALGVEHHDYGISANVLVTPNQIEEILRIVLDAPKPILVHCKNGADRSGLVAAIYLAKIQSVVFDEAADQLSLFYGHFPWLISGSGAMDESFRKYVQASGRFQYGVR
jgi:protein tyrosine phosphatase (PTP) superfamily phosphohydrolase (DUF442 family)